MSDFSTYESMCAILYINLIQNNLFNIDHVDNIEV